MDRRYVGIDLHRRRSAIYAMDAAGECIWRIRRGTTGASGGWRTMNATLATWRSSSPAPPKSLLGAPQPICEVDAMRANEELEQW